MTISTSKLLIAVHVIPEHAGRQNVVRRVMWILRFSREGLNSDAFVETVLDVDSLENFIAANEIGTERLLQWAFEAQGGNAFVAHLQPRHEEQINYAASIAGQVPFTDGFDIYTPTREMALPTTTL